MDAQPRKRYQSSQFCEDDGLLQEFDPSCGLRARPDCPCAINCSHGNTIGQMRYSIHDKTLQAKKARILINALVDCAKAGIKPSFVTTQMLRGISLYLECGRFHRENWGTYQRISDAARKVRESGDTDWKRKVTFEHVRPINQIYRMLLDERATLTLERAAFIIGEYPPVLITIEQELQMTKLGFKHDGAPEQRYAEIPISGFNLRSDDAMPR